MLFEGPRIRFLVVDDEQRDESLLCKNIPVHGKYLIIQIHLNNEM